MDDGAIERFRNRRKRLERIHNEPVVPAPEVSDEDVQDFLNSELDSDWLAILSKSQDSHYKVNFRARASDAEVAAMLDEIRGQVTANEFDQLLSSMREQVLNAVIKPFGLAKVLFQDRDGGNVSSVHNAKSGIFASEQDALRWKEWQSSNEQPFDRKPYEQGFPQRRKKAFNEQSSIQDAYTGRELNKDGRAHIEHVVSAKEIHGKEALGLYFSEESRVEIATSSSNTIFTEGSLNQSKGELPLREWMTKERKTGESNAEYFGVNTVDATARDIYARTLINGKVAFEVSSRVAQTGAEEAANMGVQQTIGLLLHELASGLVDEARDFFGQWRGGKLNSGVLRDLKIRFHRLGERLVSKWDDALKAFVEGGISGFVSNLVTFVINCFVTTFKRVVGIIREGALSLLRAFKLLLFPPEGMTRQEAAHEATKIVAAGLAVAAGLGVEEFVSKTLMAMVPFLAPLADKIATVIVGILTGIGAAILVYLLDKIDFFGVNRKRKHKLVMAELERMAEEAMAEAEEDFRIFDDPTIQPA